MVRRFGEEENAGRDEESVEARRQRSSERDSPDFRHVCKAFGFLFLHVLSLR